MTLLSAITTFGLDIAKSVFQVHGIDAAGQVVVRQQLKRARVIPFTSKLSPCTIGIEACASSHHWARQLTALGHTVKLMPPAYVKPFVKRQKNDAADAEAICEAVQRPSMRFAPIKDPEQQAAMVLHRTRHLYVRQMTAVINALRAHLAEFGIVAPQGRNGVEQLVDVIRDQSNPCIPDLARTCLTALSIQLDLFKKQIAILDRRLIGLHRTNETSKRLDAIPGVGPALATALVASVADPKAFRSGRDLLEAVQRRLDEDPHAMRRRRETVEHPFGTIKARMGATHFAMKTLPKVATEMALALLAHNLTRVMNIIGIKPLVAAIRA